MIEAFPLCWPVGYKRTTRRIDSRFKVTMDKSQKFLRDELLRMGASNLIVSTNIPVKKDGTLYADWMRKKIDDPGVAIYFKYKGREISMCCDQYERIWENIYALGKGIEALRGLERWGVSDFLDRVFTGFAALPESVVTTEKTWFEILDINQNSTEYQIKAAYRKKAKEFHPDLGGTNEMFNKIREAYAIGLSTLKVS
jgi:hypothetical protein